MAQFLDQRDGATRTHVILDISWEEESILLGQREPLTAMLSQAIKEAIHIV